MAIILPNSLDANGYEVQRARIHNLSAAPATPGVGQAWLNTTDGFIYYRGISGTNLQLVHYTALLQVRLDQFVAPNVALSMNSQRIANVADPQNLQDAATKNYVDALVAGLKWKEPCRAATTTTITRSGLQTIDGVTLQANDRVAIMDGTANAGIWVASSGTWTRATDADTSAEVFSMSFFVQEGTANGNAQYTCTTDAPITLGTTALTFVKLGAGVTYTQGTGILISGNSIQIDTTTVVRKVVATIGNGSATSFTVTHNLGTTNLSVALIKLSTGESWLPDWSLSGGSSTNAIVMNFGAAPTTNEFQVNIHG